MDNELIIRVKGELAGLDNVNAKFKVLQTTVKDADYQFRQNKISSQQLAEQLKFVDNQVKTLNLSYRQQVDLNAQIYQVQQRTKIGFTSLGKSLHDVAQASNRSQQAFVAVAYILQDLPYGIRGVANNITQLSQILGTPIWLNLAISAFTSLAVVFGDKLTLGIKAAREELQNLNREFLLTEREYGKYFYGVETEKLGVKGYSSGRLSRDLSYYSTQILFIEQRKKKEEELVAALKDKEELDKDETKELKIHEENVKNLRKQYEVYLDILKAIGDEQYRRRYTFLVRSPQEFRQYSDAQFMNQFVGAGGVQGLAGSGTPSRTTRIVRKHGFEKMPSVADIWAGNTPEQREYYENERIKRAEQILKIKEDAIQNSLRNSMSVYNSVFFDPLKAGINAIITGSGNMADAVVDAAKRMAASLVSSGIMSLVLSLLFPGAGGFGNIFMHSVGLGGVLPTPVTPAGRITGGGAGISATAVNNMRSSSNMRMQVEVVGKLGGDSIYFAGKRYEAKQISTRM